MIELPQGWVEIAFSEVTEARSGNSKLIKGKLLKSPVNGAFPAFSASGQDVWHTSYEHEGDAVVVSAVGARCGKAFLASGKWNAIANTHVVKPTGAVDPRFLFLYLNDEDFWEKGGSAQPFVKVPATLVRSFQLPPLPEQRRIVAKIDSLTGKSRRARDHLHHVPRLVEKYKQAVLAAAFRGELTREWRGSALDLPESNEAEELWSVPPGWRWRRVGEIGKVSLGRQRSPANHNGPHMRPYVRAANITWQGWDFSDVKEMNFDEHDYARFQLKAGDVLVNEGSGSAKEVGKPAIWRGAIANCCFQNTLIRVQPQECSSEYLYWYFLLSALAERFVASTQGVNIYHIGKDGLARFLIPQPPAEEQDEIVRRIETAFAWIDRLASEATSARRLIDRLDQAVLAKAFRGELVPQDPGDEPASVLLDRIRAERGAAPRAKRGRKARAA